MKPPQAWCARAQIQGKGKPSEDDLGARQASVAALTRAFLARTTAEIAMHGPLGPGVTHFTIEPSARVHHGEARVDRGDAGQDVVGHRHDDQDVHGWRHRIKTSRRDRWRLSVAAYLTKEVLDGRLEPRERRMHRKAVARAKLTAARDGLDDHATRAGYEDPYHFHSALEVPGRLLQHEIHGFVLAGYLHGEHRRNTPQTARVGARIRHTIDAGVRSPHVLSQDHPCLVRRGEELRMMTDPQPELHGDVGDR